jgi:hypothetical protein
MCKLTMKFYHALFLLDVLFNVVGVFPYFHYTCCEFESQSGRGLQHYVIKFVSDLREFGDLFLNENFLIIIITTIALRKT